MGRVHEGWQELVAKGCDFLCGVGGCADERMFCSVVGKGRAPLSPLHLRTVCETVQMIAAGSIFARTFDFGGSQKKLDAPCSSSCAEADDL